MHRATGPPRFVEDLREKLNRKRQERTEEHNVPCDGAAESKRNTHRPPPDPPSFLRDPLRGDRFAKDAQVDNDEQGLRGYRRGRGRRPTGPRSRSLNIIVEFSNPGQRTCTIDETKELRSPMTSNRGRGSYRGRRNFRSFQRSRGGYGGGRNRANTSSHLHDGFNRNPRLHEVDERRGKFRGHTLIPSVETTEDWAADEYHVDVNEKSKDWVPSTEAEEDWAATDERQDWNDQYERAQVHAKSDSKEEKKNEKVPVKEVGDIKGSVLEEDAKEKEIERENEQVPIKNVGDTEGSSLEEDNKEKKKIEVPIRNVRDTKRSSLEVDGEEEEIGKKDEQLPFKNVGDTKGSSLKDGSKQEKIENKKEQVSIKNGEDIKGSSLEEGSKEEKVEKELEKVDHEPKLPLAE